ncbi:MAG: S9 family peptidase [Vicinamibacteria bacterium]
MSGPPAAERRPVRSVVHGEERVDDYAWLRDKDAPEVTAYLEAENAWADSLMQPRAALQEALYAEMLGRIQETDMSVPWRQGAHFYYSRTEQGRQYPIYCRKHRSLEAEERVILDLNLLAEGKSFMALGDFAVSDDARRLAYTTDDTGFRQYTLFVKDLETGALIEKVAEKVGSVEWAADDRTLFYSVEEESTKRQYRLFRHEIGEAAHDLVYEEPDLAFNVGVGRTRSREWLVLGISSLTTSEARVLRAAEPLGQWRLVAPRVPEQEYDLDHHGEHFYIRANDTGRNFRLVKAPVASPDRSSWVELTPHRADVMLEGVDLFRNHCVLYEREDGLPQMRITDLRSGESHRLAFPEPVYSAFAGPNAEFDSRLLRYAYQSLVTPSSVFDYDMDGRSAALLKQQPVLGGYDASAYRSERVWATALDGVRIPISLVYRVGFERDGRAPGFLYGYGSYGYPMPISFSSNRVSLLDRGVVFAIAHVRGGGEMGKAWHDAGRLANKINSFTDFMVAAEHLVVEGYTSHDRLIAEGGSAGGLLMGAVANLGPGLFKAIVSKVPFVDVINTMLDETLPLTVGEYEEWGNPKLEADYRRMRAYCPYSNLQRQDYPAMLVKTSLNDSQVMYWEPAKYVAKLRTLKTDSNPLLLKTNMGAGHGGASGRYDALRETAFDYAFMLWQWGLA